MGAAGATVAGLVEPGTQKLRLEKLMDGFDEFENVMRDGTRVRGGGAAAAARRRRGGGARGAEYRLCARAATPGARRAPAG